MKYARYKCKICSIPLTETDEYCPNCGEEGIKIPAWRII